MNMKRIIIIAMLALCANIAHAQLFSISGLSIGANAGVIYTDAQIRAALGTPSKYETWSNEFGGGSEYQYGTGVNYDLLRWQGDKGIVGITLESTQFTMTFSGGRTLKVGENISKLTTGVLQYIEIRDNEKYYRYSPGTALGEEFVGIYTDNNGVITCLSYSWMS